MNTIKNQLIYATLFTCGVVLMFMLMAENMQKIQQVWRDYHQPALKYTHFKVSDINIQQSFEQDLVIEKYQANAFKPLADSSQNAKNRVEQIDGKNLKRKTNESQIVDHQIFASPNNIRAGKKIFI